MATHHQQDLVADLELEPPVRMVGFPVSLSRLTLIIFDSLPGSLVFVRAKVGQTLGHLENGKCGCQYL